MRADSAFAGCTRFSSSDLTGALVITRLSSRSVSFVQQQIGRHQNGVRDLVVAPDDPVDNLPLWPIIALAVRLDSRGPALYRQE